MARQDKLLDIMSMTGLSLEAKIARLARKWIGKPFDRAQAKAVVKCYLEGEGRIPDLTQRLMDSKAKQERLRNERKAVSDADAARKRSPLNKYRNNPQLRHQRKIELAQRIFGPHVKANFDEDSLTMMSLISGEDRWYRVKWLDAGSQPVRSALIEVVTMGREAPIYTRFLLYKASRVMVLRTNARSVKMAWAGAVSPKLVEAAPSLKAEGFSITPDLEEQEMVITDPSGVELKRVPFEGGTV